MSDHPQAKAVSSLIYRLGKKFTFNWVDDGEERTNLKDMKVSEAKEECLDAITSVDGSWIHVKNKETGEDSTLFIVLGNNNSEMVCDYSRGDDDLDTIITEHHNHWENK